MTVCVIVVAVGIAAFLGVTAMQNIGNRDANQTLLLLGESGQKNLNYYFDGVEQSVGMVSEYVESDLSGLDDEELQKHLDRVSDYFQTLAYKTDGVLTYYYRIDPAVSKNVKGFWYVNLDGNGFQKHEATDISLYNTDDTSQLVWFTVPKATGAGAWLSPYVTDNLNMRVISYNIPVYFSGQFIGVIGIEIDYSTMADQVDNITLYKNGYAFLNDADGNIVYHPRMDVTAMDVKPQVPSELMSSDKFVRYVFEGVEKQAVWLPLNNGMRLNVTVPVQEINAGWQNWSTGVAILSVILLLAFAFLIAVIVGRITSPLRNLTKAAEQISEGHYDCDLDYDKKDEVGVLTNTFKKVISDQNTHIGNLNDMAFVDALTGLNNRMALRRDYDSYLGHQVAVMMLDLDDFKVINDTRGHDEGDRILKETSKLLAETFGKNRCYRYGDDEFLVIVPDVSVSEFRKMMDSMDGNLPAIDADTNASFSVGFVHEMLDDPDTLRTLISRADEKMYEVKRDKKRLLEATREMSQPQMKATEYTVEEMRGFLTEMSDKYSLARVVDPIECRIIELQSDGGINMNESCYGIWNAEQKCINCSSAAACRTGCRQEKTERFQDSFYFIQSNPVKLRLSNGSVHDAVVELVNVEDEGEVTANDRKSENVGNRAAHYLAHHDSLTNVLNADAFYELSREMIKNRPDISWTMVTSNIMNFRLVNTLFDVKRGNEILVRMASMLKEISENARGLCGRLGGDQFAVLIPSAMYAEESFSRTAWDLAKTYNSGLYALYIHFGIYKVDDPSIPVSVMCGRANSALRTIREDMTRVVAYFDDGILQKTLLEQAVIGGFDEALNNGQFEIHLQPLVREDGSVIGAEALARWCKPDGTMLMPNDFIETLETASMIHRLDRHIWELAVKQLSAWKALGKEDLTISVNVSAKDFYSLDVADVLSNLVDEFDVNSRLLRLEITETALLGNPEQCEAIVSKLRQKGFLVEIDDFGKDNSTLGLLKDINADVLKIDKSLVCELQDNKRSKAILESLVGMAESLGMEVIAEGVETEQQLHALSEMGCSQFQGFYFSKPITVDVFEARFFEKKIS